MKTIVHIVGARPNFMKMGPVHRAIADASGKTAEQIIIHTGQHYSPNMSKVFIRQLDIPDPDIHYGTPYAERGRRIGSMIFNISDSLKELQPDIAIVYGDVDSTVAGAIAARCNGIKVAHVEAGLRSFDLDMPEETNRILTDSCSDLLFCPCRHSKKNLMDEAVHGWIRFVGNVMIDSLVRILPWIKYPENLYGLKAGDPYALATIHRPSNLDDPYQLIALMGCLTLASGGIPIIFPAHPKTERRIRNQYRIPIPDSLKIVPAVGYIEFISLMKSAAVVITDSGGIQEETTWLGIPCLTMRKNTERPVTVEIGTNTLIGDNPSCLPGKIAEILNGSGKKGSIPDLWDGKAGERIAAEILQMTR